LAGTELEHDAEMDLGSCTPLTPSSNSMCSSSQAAGRATGKNVQVWPFSLLRRNQ
jgi:hypothetical protein